MERWPALQEATGEPGGGRVPACNWAATAAQGGAWGGEAAAGAVAFGEEMALRGWDAEGLPKRPLWQQADGTHGERQHRGRTTCKIPSTRVGGLTPRLLFSFLVVLP